MAGQEAAAAEFQGGLRAAEMVRRIAAQPTPDAGGEDQGVALRDRRHACGSSIGLSIGYRQITATDLTDWSNRRKRGSAIAERHETTNAKWPVKYRVPPVPSSFIARLA
jgi:hypothetical protein